ncbi:ankyrin repeat-containing domain protein [Trichoderma velutinum]
MAAPVASKAGLSRAPSVRYKENDNLPIDAVTDEPNQDIDTTRFDIVSVHGFHGDGKTWQVSSSSNSPNSTRLNNLFSEIAPEGGRFIPFNYNPDEESTGCQTLQGSYRSAHRLLEVVAKSRTPEIRNARRPLYFACHDIGGVIVKTAVTLASLDESTYSDILHCIRGIIFFGYPHRSHTMLSLEEQLFWLLTLNNDRYQWGHKMAFIKSLAETINIVNDSFIHTKMLIQARVINIFSTHDDPAKRIFDKFTATFGLTNEYRLSSVKPHLQLMDDEELDAYSKALSPDKDWLDTYEFTKMHNASLRKSLHQASPIYPALNDSTAEHYSELDTLSKSYDNRILHLQCASDTDRITENVKNYFYERKGDKEKIYYFRFRSHDSRFNNVSAMLWTFFAQSVYDCPRDPLIDVYFPGISDEYPLEYQGLLHMCQNVILRNDDIYCLLILGCLDECDDSAQRFLSQIHNFITTIECRLRIVIITTKGTAKDKLIVNTLSKFSTESIAHIDYGSSIFEPLHDGFNVSMFLRENQYYEVNGFRDKIETLISSFSTDEALCHLLIKWLKSTQDPSVSLSRILANNQTPTPVLIFESILADIPEKHHLWAQKLISWVLSSFRPLRVSEFCRISNLCIGNKNKFNAHTDEVTTLGDFTNIIRQLRGLLVAVHGEVDFSHASIRTWLKSLDPTEGQLLVAKEWYRQTEQNRQMIIVQTCLEHLRDDTEQTQAWATQLPYVTQFWPRHYKQVGAINNGLESIFKHQSRLERWIDAYMALPTPFLKPSKESRKPLPIASHFGLESIVRSILASNEYDFESLEQALVEASKAAQLPVFRLLIDKYPEGLDLRNAYVQTALHAAILSENRELSHELVNHVQLPKPHGLHHQQPKEQHAEFVPISADRAKESHNTKHSSNYAQRYELMTDKETTPPESNYPSSDLKNSLRLACELDITEVVAKLISFGLANDVTFMKSDSSNIDTPLQISSRFSRLDSAKLLIAAGASIAPDDNRQMPLEAAASHGSGEIMNLLLNYGAPIDTKSSSGFTPLQTACAWGNFAAAQPLLQHRDFREYITPDMPSQPLMLAVLFGYYKVTEALLRHGADPNLRDEFDATALLTAVMKDRIDICRLLLEHKADPNLAIKHGQNQVTSLVVAVVQKNLDMVKLLIDNGADINQPISHQRTPATYYNQIDIVQYLLSRNADPNLARSNGTTPLFLAAQKGYSEIVRLLVEAQADISVYDHEYKCTTFHVVSDSAETVRALLEYGADVNREAKNGDTPLSLVMFYNQPIATKVMLSESKIKPNLSVVSIHRAMLRAVRDGFTEVVSLALEAGANVNLVDDRNTSLTALAMPLNGDSMIRTLLEYSPDLSIQDNYGNTVLHFIRKHTPAASVRRVINAGGKLDSINREYETPLMSSILACNTEVFSYLMTKRLVVDTLNISLFDKEGSPLHFACAQGTIEMVKTLIRSGANVNYTCTSVYGTPLIAATRRWNQNGREMPTEKIVRLLLDAGANPNISAGDSGYPIITASIACSTNLIQLLLNHRVSVDVKDPFGRKPAHFACYNSLEVLDFLNVPDSDFAMRDVVGRVPLHYAVLRGQLDLVEEVLARSQRVGIGIDVLDDDGWTPLLWAARVSRVVFWDETLQSSQYDAVVSFLLSKGANPSIRGCGLYKDWTVSEVAYYHHADSIADMIAEKSSAKKKGPRSKKRGKRVDFTGCYCCMLEVIGIYFQRVDNRYIRLCFKCYRSKSRIAPQDKFEECGYEWDSVDEAPEAAQLTFFQLARGEIQFDDEVVEEEDTELSS